MEQMRQQKSNRRRRGIALAETAIVISILCMLTLGTIKYGWLFVRLHQTTNAAREGARRAILPSATLAEVTAAVGNVMNSAGITGYSVVVAPDPTAAIPASEIEVTITVPTATQGVDLLPGYLPSPPSLTAKVTMAKEG